MSAPEVMNKAKEKQDEILSEKDNEKTIPTIKSQTFSRERKRKIEVSDKTHTQIKYSRTKDHYSDANSSKRVKYDAEQNVYIIIILHIFETFYLFVKSFSFICIS